MGLDARKPVFGVFEQQRHRSDCASAQADHRLCYSLYLTCFKQNSYFLAEETGLSLALSETPKTGFVASRPMYCKENANQTYFLAK